MYYIKCVLNLFVFVSNDVNQSMFTALRHDGARSTPKEPIVINRSQHGPMRTTKINKTQKSH